MGIGSNLPDDALPVGSCTPDRNVHADGYGVDGFGMNVQVGVSNPDPPLGQTVTSHLITPPDAANNIPTLPQHTVIPAKAGIQMDGANNGDKPTWIPAFAGMTEGAGSLRGINPVPVRVSNPDPHQLTNPNQLLASGFPPHKVKKGFWIAGAFFPFSPRGRRV